MSVFAKDLAWSQQKREQCLKPLYADRSVEGRYVFCDKGKLAQELQRWAVDTILQKPNGAICAIEEKIVRWPGYKYTSFTLETWSCTSPEHEKQSWMYTAKCDVLLYCFEQEDDSLVCYALPFVRLRQWFFDADRFRRYRDWTSQQINQTRCRLVPIADVLAGVPGCKMFRA